MLPLSPVACLVALFTKVPVCRRLSINITCPAPTPRHCLSSHQNQGLRMLIEINRARMPTEKGVPRPTSPSVFPFLSLFFFSFSFSFPCFPSSSFCLFFHLFGFLFPPLIICLLFFFSSAPFTSPSPAPVRRQPPYRRTDGGVDRQARSREATAGRNATCRIQEHHITASYVTQTYA